MHILLFCLHCQEDATDPGQSYYFGDRRTRRLTHAETESGFGKPEYRELELRNTFCRHSLRAPAGGRAGLRRDRKSDIDMYISTQSTNTRRQTPCCDLVWRVCSSKVSEYSTKNLFCGMHFGPHHLGKGS